MQAAFKAQHLGDHVEAVGVEAVTMNELRDGDVAFGGECGQQIETLENETNLVAAEFGARSVA